MLTGHIDRWDRHYLGGWAMDTDHPNEAVEVSVVVNGQEWKRLTAGDLRKDMATRGNYGDGRHGFTYLFDRQMSLMEVISNSAGGPSQRQYQNYYGEADPQDANRTQPKNANSGYCKRTVGNNNHDEISSKQPIDHYSRPIPL